MDAPSKELWVGVDWGDEEHAVCVVDAQGEVVDAFSLRHLAKALNDLAPRLRALGRVAGVAIESPRHLVTYRVLAEGFLVFPINPEVSHKWCKALSVAGATSDPTQAFALADGLRHHHARLQAFVPDDDQTQELRLLCEAEEDFICQRTALVNELQDRLKAYYPVPLEWFRDWTSPSAWDFAVAFPTPQALAEASEGTLYKFLKAHRIGASPKWRERIAGRREATRWPCPPAVVAVTALRVKALVALLRTLKAQLDDFRRRIEDAFEHHPDAVLFDSLPHSGVRLAPRLLGHFGTQRGRYDSARSVQQLAGCVPVTKKSGKSKKVQFRRACRKRFRNSLHQYALASLQGSEWARACYDLARARGQSNAHALRTVGTRWIQIIYRMWTTHTPYNEAVYLASLIRHGSPVIEWMQSQKKTTSIEEKPLT